MKTNEKKNGAEYYARKKEEARTEAIIWQNSFGAQDYSWNDLAWFAAYFEAKGRKYGLLGEFRENGII